MRTVFRTIVLLGGDLVTLYVSLFLALLIGYGTRLEVDVIKLHLLPFSAIFAIWMVIFFIHGLYEPRLFRKRLEFYQALAISLILGAGLAVGFFYFIPFFAITPKTNLFLTIIVFSVLFFIWRRTANHLIQRETFRVPVAFVGNHPLLKAIKRDLKKSPQLGFFVNSRQPAILVLAPGVKEDADLSKKLPQLLSRTEVISLEQFYEMVYKKMSLRLVDAQLIIEKLTRYRTGYEFSKRLIDIIISLTSSLIFALLLPLIALAIRLEDGGPVFYRQRRVGKNGKEFTILKFRTMIISAEHTGPQWTRINDRRITRVGRVLRRVYLDELPQWLNILAGHMSVVGPRPERPEFVRQTLEKNIPFFSLRNLVRPGITGWAQLNYPYARSLKDAWEKTEYDLYYIKNRSFIFDLAIISKTVNLIIRPK